MTEPIKFFTGKFNITISDIESLLGVAMSRGGDYADLYFEYATLNSLNLEEQIVKSANRAARLGVGVRVISGEKTGYAYCDEIDVAAIRKAALTAAHIAQSGSGAGTINVSRESPSHDLYPVAQLIDDEPLPHKIELLDRIDRTSRAFDRRIREAQVSLADEFKVILIATSEGKLIGDAQPLARMRVMCIADDDGNLQSGVSGGRGRVGMDFFSDQLLDYYASEAARQAIVQLEAQDAPAGSMEVVLGPGWPGVLLHEAVGHGLEADFNRKGMSAFSGLIGQKVASELCTVVDDGVMPNRRGSLNIDDEGNPTSQTVLIENGVLRGYLQDKLSSRLTGASDRDEIIRSVKRGLYAVQFGGGQVDITNGKFVFSATEAYLIEDGKVTTPVKGATLIGNGPDALTKVTAVANDLSLDEG